jgi:hypothetical protein
MQLLQPKSDLNTREDNNDSLLQNHVCVIGQANERTPPPYVNSIAYSIHRTFILSTVRSMYHDTFTLQQIS